MKAMKAAVMSNMLDISEYQVTFKVGRFIRLFIYHVLSFVMGPFVTLLIMTFDSIGLAENTAFWVKTSMMGSFITQSILWVVTITMYGFWFLRFFSEDLLHFHYK